MSIFSLALAGTQTFNGQEILPNNSVLSNSDAIPQMLGGIATMSIFLGVLMMTLGIFRMVMAFGHDDPESVSAGITNVVIGSVLISLKVLLGSMGMLETSVPSEPVEKEPLFTPEQIEALTEVFCIIGIIVLSVILSIVVLKIICDIKYIIIFTKELNYERALASKNYKQMFDKFKKEYEGIPHTAATYESISRYIEELNYYKKLDLSNVKRTEILQKIANNIVLVKNEDIYSNVTRTSVQNCLNNIKEKKGINMLKEYAEFELIYDELSDKEKAIANS